MNATQIKLPSLSTLNLLTQPSSVEITPVKKLTIEKCIEQSPVKVMYELESDRSFSEFSHAEEPEEPITVSIKVCEEVNLPSHPTKLLKLLL